jgi:hypothetical protein
MRLRFITIWATLALLVMASGTWVLGQETNTQRVIKIWLDMDAWTQVNLLKQLNNHGVSKHWSFQAAAPGESFEYQIHLEASVTQYPVGNYGSIPGHDSSVTVYDSTGKNMFSFTRPGRWTEKGASDAAAKEIIKRLAVVIGK